MRTVNYYFENAPILASKYNSLNSELLHASWSRLIHEDPGIALDIGAGSGRDANWLANKGWDVVAILAVCRTWVQKLSLQTVISVFRLFEDVRAAAHHSRPVGCIVCLSDLPRQHGAPQQPAIPRP